MNQQEALFKYLLRLADQHLILGHRMSEMSSKAPFLEEDIACSNIALDLIGNANNLLQYAASVEGKDRSADDLAFLRGEREFYNSLLAEQPNRDFAYVMMRQFFCDTFDHLLYQELAKSTDQELAAIAQKALKEIRYHERHSAKWIVRLGDGTAESHSRIQTALNELYRFTAELFEMREEDSVLMNVGIVPDLSKLHPIWSRNIELTLTEANLELPAETFMQSGSRDGKHTEHLGYLLAEMQHLHRAFPGASW